MRARRWSRHAAVCFVVYAAALLPASAAAQSSGNPGRTQKTSGEWTLYAGQMIANDLPPLAGDILTGRVRSRPAYLLGLSYGLPLGLPAWLHLENVANGPTAVLEFIGTQHFGQQHNPEIDLAFMARSPFWRVGGTVLRFGGGIGPSLALGRPSAEDGPSRTSTRRARLQTYIGIEAEARFDALPGTGILLRVHHRSSAYGLVAPKNVGSNYIVLGLRHMF